MGYTTDFQGEFKFDREVDDAMFEYMKAFNNIRHMKRDAEKASKFVDIRRESLDLPIGDEGEFYVGSVDDNNMGQDKDDSILDYNNPPSRQPGLWCQWTIGDNKKWLIWDGGEKFYCYTEWLSYLIDNIFKPCGYVLNGEVTWQGEDESDFGILGVENNKVYIRNGERAYGAKEYV